MQQLHALPNTKWFRIEQISIRGTPDAIGCVNGRFVAVEFKSSDKAKLSELQSYNLAEVLGSGGVCAVVYPENWSAAFTEIKSLCGIGQYDQTKSERH